MNDNPTRFRAGSLRVEIHPDRPAMGAAAAETVAAAMRARLAGGGAVRMVFAAAPSQHEFLGALVAAPGLDWRRVTAFHMDEYLGLPPDAPQSFGRFLREHLFDRVGPGQVHYLDPAPAGVEAECARYAALLSAAPLDVVCLGIGENGHLAFNDPPVADFDDPAWVKRVELDAACRLQQVNDGCFPTVADVPAHALTMTIPALTAGRVLSVVVPGPAKAAAVAAALEGPVDTACPASVLRRHPRAVLYLDPASAGALSPSFVASNPL